MTRTTTLLAVTVIALVGLAVAPGAVAADGDLSVGVEQADDGSAAVTVTHDGGAAANASVTVATADENASYDGTGEYATDENGSVGLPAPNETVEIAVDATTANHTASTVATLEAPSEAENETESNDTDENVSADAPFGQLVSAFVDDLDTNESDGNVGHAVATFVLENNPASDRIPDHAGPPTNDSDRGPPADRGNDTDGGPPEHAGPGGDDDDRGGPPEHAGSGGDDADEDEEDDGDEDAEDDE